MTSRNAAALTIGVAGIYFLAENVPASVLALVTFLHEHEDLEFPVWIGSVHVVLMLLFGGALLVYRGAIASRLAKDMDDASASTGAAGFHAAAISVLGLYFFVPGLSTLVADGAVALTQPRFRNIDFVRPAVQTVLGAGLFLGARGLVRVWTALRTAGRRGELAESGTQR